jgi:hypothetical protein
MVVERRGQRGAHHTLASLATARRRGTWRHMG